MQAIAYRSPGEPGLSRLEVSVPAAGEMPIGIASCGIDRADTGVLRGRCGSSAAPLVPGQE